MSQDLDLSKLSLKDALDLAVLVEEEARERYEEFADQMETHHTKEAATFFRFMAANETKHGQDLADRRKVLFGDAPRTVSRLQFFDVEAPDYDEARAFMSPRQAMAVALQCEVKAEAFFVEALNHVTDPDVQKLFSELRIDETHHKALVDAEIAKLPPASPVDDEDYVDEPVGQ